MARSARRSALVQFGVLLAALWLLGGIAAAARYAFSYYQYRGFAPLTHPQGVRSGRLVQRSFFSPALGRQASYSVYLPPQYDEAAWRSRRMPAFYVLHGSPGKPENLLRIAGLGVRLDTLLARGQVRPMMLVLPDGRINGNTLSDTEWADGRRGRYASFVLDVVHDVDASFRSLADRRARVLAGYSEGGFGAINIGLRHLNLFAGIQSWSGYYVENRFGTFANAPTTTLAANSPLLYAASLARNFALDPVRVFLYTGQRDPVGAQMAPLVQGLNAAGAQATMARYHGSHDWALWRSHAEQMLLLADADFNTPLRRPRRASAALTQQALLAGRQAAAQALLSQHLQAVQHDQALVVCRRYGVMLRASASEDFARMSPRGQVVVFHHLVRNCLRLRPGQSAPQVLCQRLPNVISIARRDALARRPEIVARCLARVQALAAPPPGHG